MGEEKSDGKSQHASPRLRVLDARRRGTASGSVREVHEDVFESRSICPREAKAERTDGQGTRCFGALLDNFG